MQVITQNIKLIFTDYLLILILVSGIILTFFYKRNIPQEKFPYEYKIATYTGIIYIIMGGGLLIITRILS